MMRPCLLCLILAVAGCGKSEPVQAPEPAPSVTTPLPPPERVHDIRILSKGQKSIHSLRVSDGFAYWVDLDPDDALDRSAIRRVAVTGGATTTLFDKQYDLENVAVAGNTLYWFRASKPDGGKSLYSGPVGGGKAIKLVPSDTIFGEIMADASGVYWPTEGHLNHLSSGTSSTVLASQDAGVNGSFSNVVADAQSVYWVEAGEVFSAPRGGGAARNLASLPWARSLATDGTTLYVAVLGGTGVPEPLGTIYAVYADGAPPKALTPAARPYGIAADARFVFFTSSSAQEGSIRRWDKSTGQVVVLARTTRTPRAIAIDDANVYWTAEDGTICSTTK